MTSRTLILNHLLDIGGVATLNNFYSPQALTHKGSLLYARKLFKSFVSDSLLEKIEPIGKPSNKAREVFYCLTKQGSQYIGRENEYKYKKYGRSPNNIMHESMKFDVALAFLRGFPQAKFSFRYDANLYGVRPDILIRLENPNPKQPTRFLLVEIERKKTVDRVFHEKINRYEEMFRTIEAKHSHNPRQFMVLVVYTDIWFDVFWRPQEYSLPSAVNHIEHINYLVRNLITHYCHNLLEHRYRFLPFHSFSRLHEPVWFTPHGNRVRL